MYEIVLLNEKGEKFSKFFDSEYVFRQFLIKAKHSKKLKVLGYWRNY